MDVSASSSVLPQLLTELRDRKVYHTGAAYIAGAFVMWEGADIVLPALGFPPSVMRFLVIAALAGLPIALVLSWLFDVIPARARPPGDRPGEPVGDAPEAEAPPGAERPPRRPGRWLGRAALVMLASGAFVACAGVAWTLTPHEQMALADGNELLVAAFDNGTGDPLFDGTLDEALRVGLAQSPHLALVPRTRIRAVLEEMRRPDATLDEATATEVALRSDVAAVLVPAIHRVGERFRLTTRLVDPATEATVVARSATAVGVDDVLPALDELARQLRADLGESVASMVRQRVPLDHATTGSLEALKAWTEGNREWDAGRHEAAGVLYRQAVALDSTFALAHTDLGQYYYWVEGDALAGAEEMAAAIRHSDHVTHREKLQIEAKAAQWRGDFEGAAAVYRTLVGRYPRSVEAWGNLGYQLLRLGRYEEATEAYEQVVAIDSLDASALLNLATLYAAIGEHDRAIRFYDRSFAIAPNYRTVHNINHEWGFNFGAAGRWEEAEAAFRIMLDGPPLQRAQGHRDLGQLRLARGRFDEAIQELRTAIRLSEAADAPQSELRNRAFMIQTLELAGHSTAAELDRALSIVIEHHIPEYFVAVLGTWLARSDRLPAARMLLDTARARGGEGPLVRAAVERLAGEIAAAEGDADAAIERFRTVITLVPRDVDTHFALARQLEAVGDTAGAEAHYREITDRPLFGNEYLVPGVLVHYRLGRLLEATRPDEAAAHYRRFLDYWGDGDPGNARVDDARGRLAALAQAGQRRPVAD